MKSAIAGAVFGLATVWLGLFVGLQVNVWLGQLLVLPMVLVSAITGTPLMAMAQPLWILAIALQCLSWALIFSVVGRLIKRPTTRS